MEANFVIVRNMLRFAAAQVGVKHKTGIIDIFQ
ncbi:Uncharacterised protein [Vibrio cholerae]|nr:Uncharacterised protein [Vibrio cholerae]CSB40962.1 Uncharacterised protein [Vibrio cholerae]CSB42891.1 Uncharacterised protein [Vibrio cholerae]CSB50967.1 Uncharacterised protein [Vibrio cholerae]CSC54554.1 Uncharacterised protein [Vibrio cholerae]